MLDDFTVADYRADARMNRDWNARALTPQSAMFYIIDQYRGNFADFYASGLRHWQDMYAALAHFEVWDPNHLQNAIEIGCGMGRMTMPTTSPSAWWPWPPNYPT
jgi:hypothetical protein